MKFLIIASAIFVVALAEHDFKKIHEKCQEDEATHVDNKIFEALKKHEKVELPANFGKHVLCMSKGFKLVTEDGKADKEHIQSHVEHALPHHDSDKVAAIVAECSESKADGEATAKHIWGCLNKNQVMGGHKHGSEESNESDSGSNEHHHHH